MAGINYITAPEQDFSGGIDARSAENQIAEKFVKDLLNSDIVEKRVRKRRGNQGYAGNVPVRVTSVDYDLSTGEVCFSLDSSVSLDTTVDLTALRSSPLVVYGRSSTFSPGDGPFSTAGDTVKYYPKFRIPTRKKFVAPSGTLVYSADEHGLGTDNLFVSVVEATNVANRDYMQVLSDDININTVSYDIDIDYTTAVDREVFVFLAKKNPVVGSVYIDTQVHPGGGSYTFATITAGMHGLQNFDIIPQVYKLNGGSKEQVDVESFVINPITGDVNISAIDIPGGTYYFILSAAPVANTVTGNIAGNTTSSITISNVSKPAVFFGIYLEQSPGGPLELVIPDSITYTDSTQELDLQFTNSNLTARNFVIYYEYGNLKSNQLCVEDASVTVSGNDSTPQLTLWGLDHSEIYGPNPVNRSGWATHIDSYRRSGEQRIISGLGGNLFSAREYSEAATTYDYNLLYPNLFTRTSTDLVLAPLFWNTGETPMRSRGYITGDDQATHWATVTDVAYDSGNGWTKYTLSIPNKAILDSVGIPTSLASVISTTSGLEDYLTIEQMSYARHEGTFRIKQVLDGVNSIQIWVENDQVSTSDYDDTNLAGSAGLFTDQISWLTSSPYIPGDVLDSPAIPDTITATVSSSVGTTTVVSGVVDRLDVAGGVLTVGARVSSVLPLRIASPDSTPSVENLVRGDMLSYTDIQRELRILYVNSDIDRSITITSSSGLATATLGSGVTQFLRPGSAVLLKQAGVYTGVQTVDDVLSDTQFTFLTAETTSASGVLAGSTIQVDEELSWSDAINDSQVLRVERRWIPLEAPDDSFNLTPSTHVRYLDEAAYTEQSFLRSTMVNDNLYLTNGLDEVYKHDGLSMYRAGLFPWSPGLFSTQETSGAAIEAGLRSFTYTILDAPGGRVGSAVIISATIPVGTPVRLTGSTETYTIREYNDDGINYYILFDRSLDAAVAGTGSVSEIGTFRCYFRLNAVDENNNVIASAITGSQDYVMELVGNAAIQHKLVGLPAWDVYDYDRLEIQYYRTKINQPAPFYLVTTLPMDFDNTQGYLQFRDSFADSDLTQLDVVSTALKGAELGTTWQEPLRAKYITSAGNKLVLANLSDYPQLDLQVVGPASLDNTDFAGDSLLFRRNNTDTATSTDMLNRVRYQWINGPTGTASAFTIGANQFSFTTSSPTGCTAGDWVYLSYATVATTARQLNYSGWYQVATCVTTTITVNLVGAAAATSYPNRYTVAVDPTDVPVLLGPDGNLGMANGDSFDTFDSMRRMALAISATMRMVDVSIAGYESFKPWLTARGGNDAFPAGRLIVRQPRAEDLTPEVVPTFNGYDLFVNSIKRASGDNISASTRIYPSRIIASYQNYPEIFDNPTSVLDTDSDSAVDVNSADGQQITGVIPFFGETAFTAAQQAAILVVFKSNSVYLVDLNQKDLGNNPVQRIETEGLGCTFPYSIAVTKNGIMFANASGMYCLRRNQTIQYLGKFMERNWTEKVDLEQQELAHGHHYGVGRVYKLSVPITTDIQTNRYIEPKQVYVYNHTAEDEGTATMGSWGRYDSHTAIGWANLLSNAFWASSRGRVFKLRNTGGDDDFRDDNQAIQMILDTRANDFGNAGIRKVVDGAVVKYRTGATSLNTTLSYSADLEVEYTETTPFSVKKTSNSTNLSDQVQKDIVPIRHDMSRRRCVYMQLRLENTGIDENIEIAGIDWKIGGLSDKGITQAAQTR